MGPPPPLIGSGARGLARLCVLLATGCAGCLASAIPSDGGHLMLDGLVFDLMACTPAGGVRPAELPDLKNRLDWSAETPFAWRWISKCTDKDSIAEHGVPEAISVMDQDVPSVFYPHVTNTYPCLHFPQPVRSVVSDDLATTNHYCFPNAVASQKPVVTGGDMTLFVKLRWDGNLPHPTVPNWHGIVASNANRDGGFCLAVQVPQDTTTPNESGILCFSVANGDYHRFGHLFSLKTNEWATAAFVVKALDDGGSLLTGYYPNKNADGRLVFLTSSPHKIEGKQLAYPHTTSWSDILILGGSDGINGNIGQPTKWQSFNPYGQFRGDIAKLQVYDRALSREEVFMLCADSYAAGSGFRIGSANGRADEFSAADGVTRADVYEPKTMSPDRLLKGLDAQNPSVTIRFPLPETEEGLPKALVVHALPDGVGASAPVAVAVNGQTDVTLNLCRADRHVAFLRKRLLRRDASGNVTLTLTRQGACAGTVRFDCLELAGAWRAGLLDGAVDPDVFAPSDSFQHHNYGGWGVGYQFVGGGGGQRYLMDTLYGLRRDKASNYYPSTQIVFNVPQEVASSCDSTLALRLANAQASDTAEISLWMNGAKRLHRKGLDSLQALTVDFKPGELNPGANTLVVSNATCDFEAVPGNSTYPYALKPDSLSWVFRPPPREGLVVIAR